jgi:hypothetical protein
VSVKAAEPLVRGGSGYRQDERVAYVRNGSADRHRSAERA